MPTENAPSGSTGTGRGSTARGHFETDSGGRTVRVDRYGAREHSRGGFQTDGDGVTVGVDRYGAKLWSEGSLVTERPKRGSK